ncbi:rab-protein geranylgeranyltransferase [Pisolithus orientalis]|uniref:rab-protein geranylgeranyltransferase n=1 Tax=Pisolithus orientalis TaxID=936130 RepID=UPI002224DBEC|nr:rab-protein geranylgeranyltransferase [Pisolithus orientalis]KAI6019655.1 rab-protein geranylgeranyltransferase [Pisolithus orientalis]
MHNVRRVRQSPAAIQANKERERSKIVDYLALTNDVISRKNNKDWSRDAFDATQKLLEKNPEFYTIWNYRRNIMLNGIFPDSTSEQLNNILASELMLTTTALKDHPKVYWLWNHRHWCLQNIPDGPIVKRNQLAVVDKMLNADPRNFMAWNYRRYVLASMPIQRPETAELAYTTRKISSSFSNFSAWHQRSKIYTSLWRSGQLDPVKSRDEELELIHNAIYTDPDDQSAWIYHRWLMGSGTANSSARFNADNLAQPIGENEKQLLREIMVIEELLDEQPDSKWCMDSLVYYNRLLLQKHRPHSTELRGKCLVLLQQLEDIDPPRRYRYWETGIQPKRFEGSSLMRSPNVYEHLLICLL